MATFAASESSEEVQTPRKQAPAKSAIERLYGYTPTRWRRWPADRTDAAKKTPSAVMQPGPRIAPIAPKPPVPEKSAADSPSSLPADTSESTAAPTLIAPAVAEANDDDPPAAQLLEPLPLSPVIPKKRTWFAEWLRSIPTKNSASASGVDAAESTLDPRNQ
jgi:hypothetical protein